MNRNEQDRRLTRRVSDAFSLRPKHLYRLHVYERGTDRMDREIRTEDFYIENPFDPETREYRYGGRISVRIPDANSKFGDLYGSYRVVQFGMTFLHGTFMKEGKATPDYPPHGAFIEPGSPNSKNWVEEL